MELGPLFILFVAFAYAIFAKRLETTIITAPMIFLGLGYLAASFDFIHLGSESTSVHVIAELALIMVLFSDACHSNVKNLLEQRNWPIRMLLIGLPLMITFGFIIGYPFLNHWPFWDIMLIAAILAPTDAALGQAVVTSKDVPERERRTLTVESGLNDGLALPIILLFASLLAVSDDSEQMNFAVFVSSQLIFGPIAGIVGGYLGAKAILWADAKKFSEPTFEAIATLTLAAGIYLGAEEIGGNGFIAAFVGGLVFGRVLGDRIRFIGKFAESEGQILIWAAFFLIGLQLLPNAISNLTLEITILILLSLFVARPAAIYLSLLGSDSSPKARLFLGWFGPRGLGTALYALVIVGDLDPNASQLVLVVAVNAVWISALLHGITAAPLSKLYGKSQK